MQEALSIIHSRTRLTRNKGGLEPHIEDVEDGLQVSGRCIRTKVGAHDDVKASLIKVTPSCTLDESYSASTKDTSAILLIGTYNTKG